VFADLGGDMVHGGTAAHEIAQTVNVSGPRGELIATFELRAGAIATSGITRRAWAQGPDVHHHILDPSRRRPAHTGLIQVSALAPTGVLAERRAKQALLSGPEGALEVLTEGGAIVHEDGRVEVLAGELVRS
jgi:thiamine biosynthesis lipoprotein